MAGLSGCISTTGSAFDSSQSLAPIDIAAQTVTAPQSQFADAGELPAVASREAAAPGEDASPEPMTLAAVVPEPAPRDGAGNPLLTAGVTLAFAGNDTGDAPPAGGAPLPRPAGDEITGSVAAASNAAAPARPKSLLEALFGPRRSDRQANAAPRARMASLGAPAMTASAHAATTDGATVTAAGLPVQGPPLPGAGNDDSPLQGTGQDDHNDDNGIEVASAGTLGRLSPNGLRLQTERVRAGCLKPELVTILKTAERHFSRPVIVTSGFRDRKGNRRAGGARGSLHMHCMAADIQIDGVSKWDLAAYLRTIPGRGGVGTYCRTQSVHIDIGEERAWHYPCRRTKKRKS